MSTSGSDPMGGTIYQRTHKGQVVCASRASAIDVQFMKWLRLVNGLTPTHILLELVAVPVADAQCTIDKLIALGLIERVPSALHR